MTEFDGAVEALEQQVGRVGSSDEALAGFSGVTSGVFSDYVELLADLGRPDAAFHILERSRARALATALTQLGTCVRREACRRLSHRNAPKVEVAYRPDPATHRQCEPQE